MQRSNPLVVKRTALSGAAVGLGLGRALGLGLDDDGGSEGGEAQPSRTSPTTSIAIERRPTPPPLPRRPLPLVMPASMARRHLAGLARVASR